MKRYIKSSEDENHVYKYSLNGKIYFIDLDDNDRAAFEDRYGVHLEYWRD